MRSLVTGASGFVGSALCRALLREGHQVVALTRDPERARARVLASPTEASEHAGALEVVAGSVADPRAIAAALRAGDVLFHAAGSPELSAPKRVLTWLHVAGTENVLRAARHAGVRRVVHVSCADVSLSDQDRMHWDEQRALPGKPIGPHAETKLMAEELALAESDDTLEVTALRPALLWGPDDIDGLARLLRGVRDGSFTLYGGGRNIIATTHIDNLTRAALLAASAPRAPARAYYISDGEFLEAREFYARLFAALELGAPPLSGSLPLALAKAHARALLGGHEGVRAELLRRAKSALFDVSRATHDLDYEAKVELDARFVELAAWFQALGGAEAVLTRARPAAREADVDAQVQAAGGE